MTSTINSSTTRLFIKPLSIQDDAFIHELVNTEGWLRFIGNRNVDSIEQASRYIERILDNPNQIYWVVRLRSNNNAIGIITLIKRDYLEHRDIGFAFLPQFSKQGFAFEAVQNFMPLLIDEFKMSYLLATTNPENENSIKLLQKLGLKFEREINVDGMKLQLFGYKTNY